MKYYSIPKSVVFTMALMAQYVVKADLSPQQIVERSQAAMETTMKYNISNGDDAVTQVVYQIQRTNGSIVSRVEASFDKVKSIYLWSDKGNYELLPDQKTAIDLSFQESWGQPVSVNPFAKAIINTAVSNGMVKRNGQICYRIQVRLALLNTNLAATVETFAKLVPNACQYLIETNTYRVLQMTVLSGKSTFGDIHYSGFDALPELPQDYFMVPTNYTIERPASLHEWQQVKLKYLFLKTAPKKIPKGFALDPETHKIVKVDPITGAFSPVTNNSSKPGRPPFGVDNENKGIRVIVLSILVISSFIFLSLLIVNKYRRK